jgi:hypothetical protein
MLAENKYRKSQEMQGMSHQKPQACPEKGNVQKRNGGRAGVWSIFPPLRQILIYLPQIVNDNFFNELCGR